MMAHTISPKSAPHTHTVVLLHGRDSSGPEFASEFFESQASDLRTLAEIFPTVKWVFPTAIPRHSARFGVQMSQWFDMWSTENPAEKEELQLAGMRESLPPILNILKTEAELLSLERVILGGISQGAALAILALMCSGMRIAGFIGFCSWLPLRSDIVQFKEKGDIKRDLSLLIHGSLHKQDGKFITGTSAASCKDDQSMLDIPIFLSHSIDDEVVSIRNGQDIYMTLRSFGFDVTWKSYEDGGHWINEPQGVDDLVEFMHTKGGF